MDKVELSESLVNAGMDGDITKMELLIQKGAEVNYAGRSWWTPLLVSVDNLDAVRLLVEHGAEVDLTYKDGQKWHGCTALMFAARAGHIPVAEFLMANGADVNAINTRKETALTWAAYKGQTEMVDFLLRNGARIDHQDDCGRTALIWAAECLDVGSANTSRLLLNNGADIRLATLLGNTAFHKAAEGNESVFDVLMTKPEFLDVKANNGDMAYDVAIESGSHEIVRMIDIWREENFLHGLIGRDCAQSCVSMGF